jgi:hypothetical protein
VAGAAGVEIPVAGKSIAARLIDQAVRAVSRCSNWRLPDRSRPTSDSNPSNMQKPAH